MRTRITLLLAILALSALVAGACGDDDDDGGGGGGDQGAEAANGGGGGGAYGSGGGGGDEGGGGATTLKLAADPNGAPKFDKTSLTAEPGSVTIDMDNPSEVPHAVEIEGQGVEEEGEVVEKGGVSTVTADLEPGEYEYYCPVGNHAAEGMTGTLTVR
jgi:plastocyanin